MKINIKKIILFNILTTFILICVLLIGSHLYTQPQDRLNKYSFENQQCGLISCNNFIAGFDWIFYLLKLGCISFLISIIIYTFLFVEKQKFFTESKIILMSFSIYNFIILYLLLFELNYNFIIVFTIFFIYLLILILTIIGVKFLFELISKIKK